MKHYALSLLVLAVAALSAPAHFVWFLPGTDAKPSEVHIVFSDRLEADDVVPIQKIARTQVYARAADGRKIPLKSTEVEGALRIHVPEKEPRLLAATCRYGVVQKGQDEPFLLLYHAKTVAGGNAKTALPAGAYQSDPDLPLDIVPTRNAPLACRVLWHGKPLPETEVVLLVPGQRKPVTRTTDKNGMVELPSPKEAGLYGIRARQVAKKAGELEGKKYSEVRHYTTLTLSVTAGAKALGSRPVDEAPQLTAVADDVPEAADPAATKLLADARAARAVWENFPGFSADLTVNVAGKVAAGRVQVSPAGKVTLDLPGTDDRSGLRRTITSLVAHRLPASIPRATPCAFLDTNAERPLGRAIRVLNDELHSSYRIRDRQIIEVNRRMKDDTRFTITVLENQLTPEKRYLPTSYVVNTWDVKTNALRSSVANHDSWTRVGAFDLPALVLTVASTVDGQQARSLRFSNHKLNGPSAE
jgi:uncharacterized GH25 family protein